MSQPTKGGGQGGGRDKRWPGRGNSSRKTAGPTAPRMIAIRVVERVQRAGAYADLALHHALVQSRMPAADRGLAPELDYGTLRWRGRLDYLIEKALDRDISKLEPLVTSALRVGAYQLFFSDRIPANAAVDEAVRCVRAMGLERATGLTYICLHVFHLYVLCLSDLSVSNFSGLKTSNFSTCGLKSTTQHRFRMLASLCRRAANEREACASRERLARSRWLF